MPPRPDDLSPQPHPQAPRPGPADAHAALVLVLLSVAFITLYPFGLVRTAEVFREQLAAAFSDPVDLFLPVHAIPALVMALLARAAFPRAKALGVAVSLAGVLLTLEALQVGVRYRHARAGDVVVQWVGLGIGVWIYSLVARVLSPVSRFVRTLWALALVLMVALSTTVVIRGQMGHTIKDWDDSFLFLLGDEYKGVRPWSGVIHHAGVYAGEATSADVSGLTPSMIYDLAQGPESLGTIDLPLRTHKVVYGPDGLDLDAGKYAQGTENATEIIRAIEDVGAGTFMVECTPTLTNQSGPARLITLSKGPDYRNMTAAQDGDALVLRVRTPRSGRNAGGFQSRWEGVFRAGERVRLVVTSTGAHARLWVDGERRGVREHVTQLGDWMGIRSTAKSWIAGVVLFLPIGLIGVLAARSKFRGCALAFVSGLVPIGAALGTAHTMGLRPPISAVVIASLCLMLGVLAGFGIAGSRRRGRRPIMHPPADGV